MSFTTLDYVLGILLGHKNMHLEMCIINQIVTQTIQFLKCMCAMIFFALVHTYHQCYDLSTFIDILFVD